MNHGVFAPVYKVEILTTDQETDQKRNDNDRRNTEDSKPEVLEQPVVNVFFSADLIFDDFIVESAVFVQALFIVGCSNSGKEQIA